MVALFGRYQYERELGRGASGRVFAARDLAENGALRALKVIDGEQRAQLIWEFDRLGRIDHPHVARVRELLRVETAVHAPYALAAGALVLVEDAALGVPLSQLRLSDQRDARESSLVRIALGAAAALAAIHDAGLVHGDVKPENLIVDEASLEVTLVDLGFAGPPSLREVARGTPRFMAPELFSGLRSCAADVYALGALLLDVLSGETARQVPSGWGSGPMLRDCAQLEGLVSPALIDVVRNLVQADVALRPPDGHAVRRLLAPLSTQTKSGAPHDRELLHGVVGGDARAARARTLPFVGRTELLDVMRDALLDSGLILVRGARGAGRSRLIREATRQLQLSCASEKRALPTVVRSFAALEQLRDISAILWLEAPPDALQSDLQRATRLLSIREQPLCVLVECPPQTAFAGARTLDVSALAEQEHAQLLDALLAPQRPDEAVSRAARVASQGLAGRLCEVVAQLFAKERDVLDPRAYAAASLAGDTQLSDAGAQLAELFAWWGADLDPADVLDAPAREVAFAELWTRGLLVERDGAFALTHEVARALRKQGADRRAQSVKNVTRRRATSGFALLALRHEQEAADAFLFEAQQMRAAGETDAAQRLLSEACAYLPRSDLLWLWADTERALANYATALDVLKGEASAGARLLCAEVERLRGQPARALALAQQIAAEQQGELRARADALLARLAFDAAQWSDAHAAIHRVKAQLDAQALVRALEVELLLHFGRGDAQRPIADELVARAAALAADRPLARALSLRSQLLARSGERASALRDGHEALRLARAAGELHESATFALNLGLLQLETGDLGAALETLRDAAYRLTRIDRPADLARILFNLANAALLVGDDARAQMFATMVEGRSDQLDAHALAFLACLRADLSLRQGHVEAARHRLEAALPSLAEGLVGARVLVIARLAQVRLLQGESASAMRELREVHGLVGDDDVPLMFELRVAELRTLAALGRVDDAEQLVQRTMAVMVGAPFAEAVRFLLTAIDIARMAGEEGLARERTALCRARLERALSSLPPSLRARMRERPEYARVLSAQLATTIENSDAMRSGPWRSLVTASRRLFATTQRARIAEELTSIALELVHAERALLIGCTEQGALEVRARAELAMDTSHVPPFSRSVIERVWTQRASMMTVDASHDQRLHAAQSIHALSVRSVLAVPVSGFGEPSVLYLDDRLRSEAFGAQDVALLEDLAALAGEALKVARLREEQRRRTRKAEHEVDVLTRALEENSAAAEARRSPLVGVSRALLQVTDSARRVAASDVSLLVTGESGTGKELLARFVHDQSPRAARPFVAESCAALPDALLESALFGHVRGAFTGAERVRRGLFEIADQGTLFLDEVGEMSPALQGKLLRVLQEGEFRPLGSERVKRVNVRVIAATRRDLPAQVRLGHFREDLYYRLAVVTLELPSLDKRREDIPLLVRHFVDKHQPAGRHIRVSAAALRAFAQRDLPGNVRQLENEVRRALAFCRDDQIDLADLPPEAQVAAQVSGVDGLHLHTQLDGLTRKLIDEAMARASGNVTQAAQLLGISRFGLQKMLKRYHPNDQRK